MNISRQTASNWTVISGRWIVATMAAMVAAAVVSRLLPADDAFGAAARLVTSALAVGLVPGTAVLLACGRGVRLNELELLGFGVIVSFVLVQFATIVAVSAHWPMAWTVGLLAMATLVAGALAWRAPLAIEVSPGRTAVLAGLLVIGALLYVQGAPYSSSEDQIHVALTRRLAFWPSPSADELYILTGTPRGFYPYPFPAIHYLIGLINRVSDLDTLFVYHKLRAFWGPPAVALVYAAAAAIFGPRAAMASVVAAMVFVLNGAFTIGYNYFWGQLAPFSHASDVAMGLLLPGLIALTCRYAMADTRRQRAVFAAAGLGLTFSLCIVHAREVVQQLMYLAALLAAAFSVRRQTGQWRWVAALLVGALAVTLAYRGWHSSAVGFVNDVVGQQRELFLNSLRSKSWFDLLIGVPSLQAPGAQLLFRGWNPIVLLLTPVLLIAYPARALVRFIAIAILGYLLVTRFQVFTIPYVLASYFEITTSPMRNFIFFIHVTTGVMFWTLARALAALPVAQAIAGAGVFLAWVAVMWQIGPTWLFEHQDWFFIPAIAFWLAALVYDLRSTRQADDSVRPRQGLIMAMLLGATAILTFAPAGIMASNAEPSGSALTAKYAASMKTPDVLFAHLGGCVPQPSVRLPFQPTGVEPVETGPYTICPYPDDLLRWARAHIRPDAVVATSKINPYPIAVYLPVRMVAWPSVELTYHNETRALETYYRFWSSSLRRHRAQPFFNASESLEERRSFLDALGVEYVVVDPQQRASVTPVLERSPELLTLVFAAGDWSVFQVRPSSR
jgi:hypothetical protein